MADWSRPFEDPIPVPDGRTLLTLKDAGDYITSLPKAEQDLIGVLRALTLNVKGMFNSGHKDTLGKARKIKTVQGTIRELGLKRREINTIRERGRFITVSWFFRWNSCFDSRVSAASISF
jgi:hypothetical protein